jgi:hypothetical protein
MAGIFPLDSYKAFQWEILCLALFLVCASNFAALKWNNSHFHIRPQGGGTEKVNKNVFLKR